MKTNSLGKDMYDLIEELYPICRSITGGGVRDTLKIISTETPIKVKEVESGTQVFDWVVPMEWNIKDAYIENSKGERIVDFKNNNLHVVNYSVPVRKTVSLKELKEHLFSLPDHPDWIPYRTTYYDEEWGFCLSHNQLLNLKDEQYKVVINSSLEKGSLTYGELVIRGALTDEVLISTHICHPSMCNDNLSGIVVATYLAKYLNQKKNKYSYRFLFIPGTIGSIIWLALNEKKIKKIKHGFVLTGLGDSGSITYKKSRHGNNEIDRASEYVLKNSGEYYSIIDFYPFGYDERQYCSPGFNLPMGTFMRSPHGKYPEYHTSADNLKFIKPEKLNDSLQKIKSVIEILEGNKTFINLNPKCEPQLGKRGIYKAMNEVGEDKAKLQMAILWVLNLSDGSNSLLDIAEKSSCEFELIRNASTILLKNKLLKENENG
jgi:aminopeptidase-like protein